MVPASETLSAEKAYVALLGSLSEKDGWRKKSISVANGLATAVLHWNSYALEQVAEKVREFWPVMRTLPGIRKSPERRYQHPMDGDFADRFFSLIRNQRESYGDYRNSDFPLLLSFFSDATLLANKGSMSAHPLIVTIANLPEEYVRNSIIKVGYFDLFRGPKQTSEDQQRQLKRALFAEQLDAMLEPFRRASFTGYTINLGEGGDKVRFFPALFDMPIDNPEVSSVLQHKSGYCGICYWKTSLGSTKRRTEQRSRDYYDQMTRKRTLAGLHELGSLTGAHPQRSGAWGFNGSCPVNRLPTWTLTENPRLHDALQQVGSSTGMCDLHLSVTTESMHEVDLGLVVYFKNAIFLALKKDLGSLRKVEQVNEYLEQCLSSESRWQGLLLPPVKRETATLKGYWGGSSRVEATEHRAVLQVIVPVLYRALHRDHRIVKAATAFMKFNRVRMRRFDLGPEGRFHTEKTLAETNRLYQKVRDMIHSLDLDEEPGDESSYTPKMHAQVHFAELVRRNGFSAMLTGELGENHNAKIKAPYRGGRTNRQRNLVTQQLVRHEQAVQASRSLQSFMFVSLAPDLPQQKYDTAGCLAIEADACKLTKYTSLRAGSRLCIVDIVRWCDLRPGSRLDPLQLEKIDKTSAFAANRLLLGKTSSNDPRDTDRQSRESRQCEHLFGHSSVADEFVRELQWQLGVPKDGNSADSFALLTARLRHTPNAVVPAVTRGQKSNTRHRVLQSLRAHRDFHGSPWFDFVAITSGTQHMADDLFYARLVFFFHFPLPDGSRLELAFVRWCSRVHLKTNEGGETLDDFEPDLFELQYTAYTRHGESRDRWLYGVIRVESIIRKIHVVAGNDAASRALLNPYPTRRGQADIDDSNAIFLVNGYVWERGGKQPYIISEQRLREFE